MSEEGLVNWDSRIDNCLLNAEAILSSLHPGDEDFSDQNIIASGWMALGELWLRRQANEAEFDAWRGETEYEEAT